MWWMSGDANGFAAGKARHQGSALPWTADAALCVGHTCSEYRGQLRGLWQHAHLTGGEPSYLSAHCVPAVCSSQVWTLWCRQLEGCTLVRDLGHPGQMAVYYGRVPWVHGALDFLLIVNHVFQSYLFFNLLQWWSKSSSDLVTFFVIESFIWCLYFCYFHY